MQMLDRAERLLSNIRELLIEDLSRIVADRPVVLVNQQDARHVLDAYFVAAGAPAVTHIRVLDDQPTLTGYFRDFDDELAQPSSGTRQILRSVDPHREAVVYAGSPISAPQFDRREILGRRTENWKRAESKESQVALLGKQDGYEVSYSPIEGASCAASIGERVLQLGSCVLSGDPLDAISMASDHSYFLNKAMPTEAKLDVCRVLTKSCRGIRIARFTRGCPSTIYGVVADGQVALLGPVEALVGYHSMSGRVVAPGVCCPVDERYRLTSQNLALIESQVLQLVKLTGYRGAFGADGVHNSDRFIVHEINTRVCGGFSLVSRVLGGRLAFGVVDIVARASQSRHIREVLLLLNELNESLPKEAGVRIWGDPTLELELSRHIPAHQDLDHIRAWRDTVRDRVFRTIRPFLAV